MTETIPALAITSLTHFSGEFDEITTQFARGQMPQARGNVTSFESPSATAPTSVVAREVPEAVDLGTAARRRGPGHP